LCVLMAVSTTAQRPSGNGFDKNQSTGGVSGILMDEDDGPIPFASIVAYAAGDERKLIKGANSDDNGRFALKLKPGSYDIEMSFLSFKKIIKPSVEVSNTMLDFGKLVMLPKSTDLKEVTVTGERRQMEFKLDKRIYNVGSDLGNNGTNALELLDNVPSVTVDVDGNVSLRGSQNVRILVDGKASGLAGIGSTDALRSLRGTMIEKVEIITNPSAKYDAEGEVGVLNIVLKKNRKKGFNGSFDFNVGYPENFGVGFNLNSRQEKFNLFSNLAFNYRNSPGKGESYAELFTSQGDFFFESDRSHERKSLSGSVQLGVDYFMDKENTITFAGLYKLARGRNDGEVVYRDLDETGTLLNTTTRSDTEKEPGRDIEFSLNHTRKYKTKGKKWSSDLSYMINEDTESNEYREVDSQNSILEQRSDNIEDQLRFTIKTDFVQPIGKEGKVELGAKLSLRSITNDYYVEENSNGTWTLVPGLDNALTYEEDIYAAYAMYGNTYGKWGYQGGLRVEYSDIKTILLETNDESPRSYVDFFPTAHLTYELNETNQLQLSYSRRISRPRFWYLLPFLTFTDNRSRFQGNPELDPEYSDSYELGYLRYFDKGSLLSTLFYRHKSGRIERVNLSNDDGTTSLIPYNVGFENDFGLEFSGNYDITKKWQANGSVNFYQSNLDGEFNGQPLNNESFRTDARLSTKLKLPKSTQIQLSGRFRSPSKTSQGSRSAMYTADFGSSKEVLNGNGTLTFNIRDIFNSRKRKSITDTPAIYRESEFQWRSRSIVLGFNYRVNQKKKRPQRGGGGQQGGGDGF